MVIAAIALVLLPAAIGLYAYGVYPALLYLLSRRAPRTLAHEAAQLGDPTPIVSIVIPAYNEERQIRGAIESALSQDYPVDRRQILVLSDASTDATDDIVGEYALRGVDLLRMPERTGKTAAENASISKIRGDVIVNTDASIRMDPQTVSNLILAMRDPAVGVASTRDVSVASRSGESAESTYVSYEMLIRRWESLSGGIVGASGSGYAIRRELHAHAVRADLSRDFSAALTAHRHGYRSVSVDEAVCYVPATASLAREYRRKVRTISRGMETLLHNRDLLDPIHHGPFAWKLLSHKLARWLVPPASVSAVVGLLVLAPRHRWAMAALWVAITLAVLAIVGSRWPESRPVPAYLPRRLLGMLAANLAVVHAWWRVLHGHEDHVWEPTRRA